MNNRPVFTINRDGHISATYNGVTKNFGGSAINASYNPVANVVNDSVNQVGEDLQNWWKNNGVNVFFILIGLLIMIAFTISVVK